ncbi:pyrroline-5-carboxylate reductase dimerization-domain-containing protein, partial [Dactylonectria macrodidyma]
MTLDQTLAIVGCGNMGSAILSGLLDAARSHPNPQISRFIVSTKSASSAERLRTQFADDKQRLHVAHCYNVQAIDEAATVILACKPHMAEEILAEDGVREALAGKFLISVLGGKSRRVLEGLLHKDGAPNDKPYIVRAMPNMAARVRLSMTIVEENPALPADLSSTLTWIFEQIGEVKMLATSEFDVGSMLVGSSMAVLSVGLDGVLDGCVMEGIRRADALQMAAQCLAGMAELLRQGEHPAQFREAVSSPRGSTITGIMTVEKAGVRGTFAQSIVDGARRLQE